MAVKWAVANGNWSSGATWNGGTLPVAGDDVYSNNFTVTVDTNINVASLNNSALAAQSTRLNPIMTSNTTPSGVASASSFVSGGEQYRAFDNSTTSGWAAAAGAPQWVQYQFTSAVLIRSYSIWPQPSGQPSNFNLQGSNDGVVWVTLDTRVGFVWTLSAYNTFTITGASTAYSYYRLNITAMSAGNPAIIELTLNEAGITTTAGGGFNFNTAGVTASITGATPLSYGAANLLTFAHTTGDVTMSLSNTTTGFFNSGISMLYSGNGNLNFTVPNINLTNTGINTTYLSKTGAGTLTINGNLLFVNSNAGNQILLNSTNGNVVINGNINGASGVAQNSIFTIRQTAGSLTINGNLLPPSTYIATAQTINFSGTTLTINGNLLTGVGQNVSSSGITTINGDVYGVTNASGYGLSTSATTTITGDIYGDISPAVFSSSANTITIIGDITASSANNAVVMTSTTGILRLTGNLYNVNNRQAFFGYNIFVNASAPMQARFFTPGIIDRTLYSEDTFPNQPAATNVRESITYGPGSGLIGTLAMPAAADVRSGVVYDSATTGTALFTTALLLSEINSSATPVAVRLRNAATPEILGTILAAYKP